MDWQTFFSKINWQAAVAIWGAGLSTILGYKEYQRGRKKLDIAVRFSPIYGKTTIIITYMGPNIITLTGIRILEFVKIEKVYKSYSKQERKFEIISDGSRFPIKISNGESIIVKIEPNLNQFLHHKTNFFVPEISDSTGRKYYPNRSEKFDSKYGGFYRIKNKYKRNYWIEINTSIRNWINFLGLAIKLIKNNRLDFWQDGTKISEEILIWIRQNTPRPPYR